MNLRSIPLAALLALIPAAPAMASSLPRADFSGGRPTIGLGVGSGNLSACFDVPINADWMAGLGASSVNSVGANADVRVLYRFWRAGANPLTLAVMGGAQGQGGAFGSLGGFSPFVGLAAAYPITGQWTLRANVAMAFWGPSNMRPSGAEVAYRFHPNMEGTIGWNGRGDFLGVNLLL